MEQELPPGISAFHHITYLSGCKTAFARYNHQPVVCKVLSFRSHAPAEKCISYFKLAMEVVRRCRHVAAILDVLGTPSFTVWIIFENLQKSLETEMKERRDHRNPWSEEETRVLLLPLLSDLAQLESSEISVSFLHPRKLFIRGNSCVVSKVSYNAYDRQKMKAANMKFVMPEFGQIAERDGKKEFAHFTRNNVFCLGLIAYCMLTNTDPESIVIDIQSIHRTLGTLQLSESFSNLMHQLVAFDPSMRSSFIPMAQLYPLYSSEIRLKLGENFITLKGIETFAGIRNLVESALHSKRFELFDEKKKSISKEEEFSRMKSAAALTSIPMTLEVVVNFEIRSLDSSALG